MIKAIHMKEYATYNVEGATVDNCKKVNFIYGANGSGKSTISNYLMNRANPRFKACSLEWESGIEEDILVYNREFKDANFAQTDIDGVFTIGRATIDEQRALEEKKKELSERNIELGKTSETLKSKQDELLQDEKNFRELVWNNIFKKYEHNFSDAFIGFKNSKEKLFNEAQARYDAIGGEQYILDDLLKRATTLFGDKPNVCNFFNLNLESIIEKIESIQKDTLWQEVIVGSNDIPIGMLIHRLNSNAWVNKGMEYIEENSKICPFCQQPTITHEFREQLKDFFDESYKLKIASIKKFRDEYSLAISLLNNELEKITADSFSVEIGKFNLTLFESQKKLLMQILNNNYKNIEEKQKYPERKIFFEDNSEIIKSMLDIVKDANNIIDEHNKLLENFNQARTLLIDNIWEYILNEERESFVQPRKKIHAIEKAIGGLSEKINKLKDNIKQTEIVIEEMGKNITSVQPTVDEINRLLKAYGFNNFKITPSSRKEYAYQIQREDGSLATNTLSEGEETFVTFLYFMQMSKGSIDPSRISNKKILVLDDPICSLDSTILYVVSTMVKELANSIMNGDTDVSQLFVFTHNVFFHKEVSFIDGRPNNKNGDVNYWIIKKNNNISTIKSYAMVNPIRTSYDLLWKELREEEESSLITIQNVMRRIIENYFNMLGRGREAFIESNFDSPEDSMICKSLFCWINDGSHTITDDLFIDPYTDSIERYKYVFHQIFIKTGNEAHYNMMMEINK